MKTCSKCNIPKSEADFEVHSSGRLRGVCRECCCAQRKNYYTENKKAILAQQKEYCIENRKKISARKKAFRVENRDEIAAKKRVYYAENRKDIRVKQRGYYTENKEEIMAQQKEYLNKNRAARNAYNRVYRHGLSLGDIERMSAKQGGVCAICNCHGGKRGLFVDHDHDSGKVRALLCSNCNTAIGFLKDSSTLVFAAAEYLKLHGK